MGGTCLPYRGRCSPHPGACKFTLQYDGSHDGRFGVQVGTWNLGSVSGKGGEVFEELRKGMIDVCCLHKVKWKG